MTNDIRAVRTEALLSYDNAAKELGVSKRTLRRWIDEGQLPSVALSSRIKRIKAADLREFVHLSTATNPALSGVTLRRLKSL